MLENFEKFIGQQVSREGLGEYLGQQGGVGWVFRSAGRGQVNV